MKLILRRTKFYESCTIGRLYAEENFICWTLEDKDRGLWKDQPLECLKTVKVYGQTAIPYGTYEIIKTMSPRFKKVTPLLLEVPGFEGIRIHSANRATQLEGCIAPGLVAAGESVIDSRIATINVNKVIDYALSKGKLYIEITK